MVASKPFLIQNRRKIERRQINEIIFKSASSINNKFPNKYPSISVVIPPPPILRATKPRANIPVRKIAIEASPVRISLD